MTDMLQKSENVANNVANKNSQDLTEKWRKGELPEGWYWVKDDDGQIKLAEYSVYCIDRETNETEYDWSCLDDIEQVLAEVPDYIDWRNMVNCACEEHKANKRLIEENAQLKERNDSLNNRDINLCRIANGIRDENFALKELLKACKDIFDECFSPSAKYGELYKKIDEALK